MRTNMFGQHVVDSAEDDLGDWLAKESIEPSDVNAEIAATDGKWGFEIRTNDDGDEVIGSLEVFESEEAVRDYLKQWISADAIGVVE